MTRYRFTPQALDDLFEIWSYIAQDDLAAADRVEQSIYSACELLAGSPLGGTIREQLTSLPVRFWPVTPYPELFHRLRPGSQAGADSSDSAWGKERAVDFGIGAKTLPGRWLSGNVAVSDT